MKKSLVIYFSVSGETREKAIELAKAISGDVYEIKPVENYTSEDLNWRNKMSRSTLEMTNEKSRPA